MNCQTVYYLNNHPTNHPIIPKTIMQFIHTQHNKPSWVYAFRAPYCYHDVAVFIFNVEGSFVRWTLEVRSKKSKKPKKRASNSLWSKRIHNRVFYVSPCPIPASLFFFCLCIFYKFFFNQLDGVVPFVQNVCNLMVESQCTNTSLVFFSRLDIY